MDVVVTRIASPRQVVKTLIGREPERLFLREELIAARAGNGRLVLVGGEAGIGKTTLARDLVDTARELDTLVLIGHCSDLSATPPYGPWLDLAAAYRPGERQPQLPDAISGGQLEGVRHQAALFSDLLGFLSELSRNVPVVIMLEDLHWADPASLDLLRFLGPRISDLPILLLVTYRVDELTRRHPFYQQLPSLVRTSGGLRLDLRRLQTDDLRQLIRARYQLPEEDEHRLLDYLARHADGNPLFATELLRALEEDQLLSPSGDGWRLDTIDRLLVPALLNQVIDARVDRLGEETRRLLSLASVIGQDVPLDLWAEIGDLDEEALIEHTERALDAHLMEFDRDDRLIRFVHALTRAALYTNIVPPRRRLWHRRVANALIDRPHSEPDVIAHHLQAAGDERASEWLIRAGERAQRAYAWLTAAERFQSAAAALAGLPGEEENQGWLLYRAARLLRLAQPADGIKLLEDAERLGIKAANPLLVAEAQYSRGLLLIYTGVTDGGYAAMSAGVELMESLTDSGRIAARAHRRRDCGLATQARCRCRQ